MAKKTENPAPVSQADEEAVLGKPGVPEESIIIGLPGPVKEKPKPLLDLLGRPLNKKNWYQPAKDDPVDQEDYTPPKPAILSGKRDILVFSDTDLVFPDLWNNVYVEGDKFEQGRFAQLLVRGMCMKADTPEEADYVIFTGGSDVDPRLYGEDPYMTHAWDEDRDSREIGLFIRCKDEGIPMVGICRGAQFLHVMHGGKLYQDINGHHGDHPMTDLRTKDIIQRVSSVHHQAVIFDPKLGMEVLATSARSSHRVVNRDKTETGAKPDIEAFFYRETCSFGVQGHPEYQGYYYFQRWFLRMLDDLINLNPDLVLVDGKRRMNPDIIKQREAIEFELDKGRPKDKQKSTLSIKKQKGEK